MIQDRMIEEIQELKLAGYTAREVYEELKSRYRKVPTLKTVRKYYNMDRVPDDNHAKVRKQMAFDCEPFASAIVELNPGCHMSVFRKLDFLKTMEYRTSRSRFSLAYSFTVRPSAHLIGNYCQTKKPGGRLGSFFVGEEMLPRGGSLRQDATSRPDYHPLFRLSEF